MKMKNMLMSVLFAGALLTGCTPEDALVESETEVVQEESMVVVTVLNVDDDVVVENEVIFEEGEVLMDVMEREFELDKDGEFITGIEGETQSADDNIWWVFEVNEEMVTESADTFELTDGDYVEWKLLQF